MRKLNSFIIFSILSISIFAQNSKINEDFSIKSQYLFKNFINGNITLKDSTIIKLGLNYNVFMDEIHYYQSGQLKTFTANDYNLIEKIIIDKHSFICFEQKIYEVLIFDHITLLKRREIEKTDLCAKEGAYGTKVNSATVQAVTVARVTFREDRAESVTYIEDLDEKTVAIRTNYKLKYQDTIYIPNLKFLNIIYPNSLKKIKKYKKDNKIKFNNEDDLMKMINYCNNNL